LPHYSSNFDRYILIYLGNAPGTPHSALATPGNTATPGTPFSSAPPTPQQQTPKFATPPVVTAQPITPSQQLLNDLFKLKLEQKEKIDRTMKQQKQLMTNPQQEPFNTLTNEHRYFQHEKKNGNLLN
jgi:hypothetical protein